MGSSYNHAGFLSAKKALSYAGVSWFAVAFMGQLFFAYYVVVFYGGTAASGDWQAWTNRLIHGFVEEDLLGNLVLVSHMVLAFYVSAFGPLQLVPSVRKKAPRFHRINGRVYISVAFLISTGALYLTWSRGGFDGKAFSVNSLGISINGLLIIVFAALALKYAMARKIVIHQVWAMRLFMAMSGVWFMRVGYGFWFFLFSLEDAPGVTQHLDGWFDKTLPWLASLLPLALLELYFSAQKSRSIGVKWSAAALFFVLTLVTGIGVVIIATIRWIPLL
ncbi:MAG: DUF2306 domain-containing protein [Kordiimonadaceae bacterium]|nr:DUF2306 domain-containing protein [Kordiimonadaceae bacterium]MBO6568665.1 DUF2306 domain-containing protein [Kordiimonadaceae bacterium]MBO6965359.1 DUF2306 domain-containing protein [Kordiimonadaceae bacterium]